MKKLMNFLRGMVVLRAEGAFPERLMNLCAQEGVEFWGVEWMDTRTLRLTARRYSLRKLKKLAERVSCTLEVEESRGAPAWAERFRTRYAFLLGLMLCLLAVSVLSRFVLTIQITGNETVPDAVILNQLRLQGVRRGVYGPAIRRRQQAEDVLTALRDLSWVGINLQGTRLIVDVREKIPAPEQLDESGYYDIAAAADGLILKVEPEQGDAVVKSGDTVVKGDILISGVVTMEPPKYSDRPVRTYRTHARGRVTARTWRTLTAVIPLETAVKEYIGEEKQVFSLELPGRRIEIFGNNRIYGSISGGFYDKITTVRGGALPVILRRDLIRAYTVRMIPVDPEAAQALLEQRLLQRLEELVGEDGLVTSSGSTAVIENGLLRVTVQAECREQIGRESPGREQAPKLQENSGV